MKIVIDGIERYLDEATAKKLNQMCEVSYTGIADMVISMIETQVKSFVFDTFCEYCGCKRAKSLGGLESHSGNCPNIPY